MPNVFKIIPLLALFGACSSPVEKPDEKIVETAQESKNENASESGKENASIEDSSLIGIWRPAKGTHSGPSEFRFCKDGEVRLTNDEGQTAFQTYSIHPEEDCSKLHLGAPNTSNQRSLLYRSVDENHFEVAIITACPARKRCFVPSFEHLPALKYERVSEDPGCTE